MKFFALVFGLMTILLGANGLWINECLKDCEDLPKSRARCRADCHKGAIRIQYDKGVIIGEGSPYQDLGIKEPKLLTGKCLNYDDCVADCEKYPQDMPDPTAKNIASFLGVGTSSEASLQNV